MSTRVEGTSFYIWLARHGRIKRGGKRGNCPGRPTARGPPV